MNLEDAIKTHSEWRMKFRSAIAGSGKLHTVTIGKDNCCALGKWLYTEGRAKHGTKAEFQRVMEHHKGFYLEAGKIASPIKAGRRADAKAALSAGPPYASASAEAGAAIIGLQRAAGP